MEGVEGPGLPAPSLAPGAMVKAGQGLAVPPPAARVPPGGASSTAHSPGGSCPECHTCGPGGRPSPAGPAYRPEPRPDAMRQGPASAPAPAPAHRTHHVPALT